MRAAGPVAWFLAIRLNWGISGIITAISAASFLSATLLLSRFRMLARRD